MKKASELIKIKSWKENKDGSANMTYDLTDTGIEVFKKLAATKKKKFCPEFCNQQILIAIKNSIKESKNV